MKISVIIPAYNAEPYIAKAIESCLQQTRPPDEIIVTDDCSTDRTAEIAQAFPAIRLIRLAQNSGVAVARNRAIEASTGDWLAFLDADDWFFPRKLELQEKCIRENPNAVLIYCGCRIRFTDASEQDAQFVTPDTLDIRLRYACVIPTPSVVMLRRGAWESVGGFSPLCCAAEDWDLWLRIADRYSTAAFAAVPEPLMMYCRTPGSLSSRTRRQFRQFREIMRDRSLYQTSGLSRFLLFQKINAYQHFDFAIAIREEGSEEYLGNILKSLLFWPFPNAMLPLARYRVAAVMLVQKLGWWPNPFRTRNALRDGKPPGTEAW